MTTLLSRLRTPIGAITAVLALALVTLLAIALTVLPQDDPEPQSQPVEIARRQAINFFTLDYRRIDTQLAAVQKLATGAFATQYKAKAATIKRGIVSAKLSSNATVDTGSTAVEFQDADRTVVLVGVDSTTTAPASAKAKATEQTNRYRMRLTVVRTKGDWLVSSIEQVG